MNDLSGQIFGRLKIKNFSHKDKNYINYWLCECSCGNGLVVRESSLKKGITKSCGCLKTFLNKQKRKNNKFTENGECLIGVDEQGKEFYFDIEDYEKIKTYYWSVDYNGYANANISNKKISFHRFIMNAQPNDVIDHINRIPYDNRKSNLRFCTDHQNVCNKKIAINNKSGKTGVCKEGNKWHAYIFFNGKTIHLGRFHDVNDAIAARISKEIELFGEFSPFYKQ